MKTLMKILNKILDFIFPPKCPFCDDIVTDGIPVCKSCMEKLPFTDGITCDCCGRPIEDFSYRLCNQCNSTKRYFEHSFVPLIYEDDVREAILKFKNDYYPYHRMGFAYLMANKILSSDKFVKFDYVTCVPSNRRGKNEHGYNQAELLARALSGYLQVPFTHTLIRTNEGRKQSTLNAEERMKNVKLCYKKGKKTFKGGTVLLVDDVFTTGATTNYCSRLLKQLGFEKVYISVASIRCLD